MYRCASGVAAAVAFVASWYVLSLMKMASSDISVSRVLLEDSAGKSEPAYEPLDAV